MRTGRVVLGLFALAALASAPAAAGATENGSHPQHRGLEALDYAFRFASAIHADLKDKGRAQEAVILELAGAEMLDEGVRRADLVVGWRRGTVYADLASMMIERGREDDARALIEKARGVHEHVAGWQQKRIEAHLAQALALLGDVDTAERMSAELAANDPRQYTGRAAATVAAGLAAKGNFEGAMRSLEALGSSEDFDVAWWRTVGYIMIAREASLKDPQRVRALAAARSSADGIAGWKRAEALDTIAKEHLERGDGLAAQEALAAADAIATSLPETMPIKVSLLALVARSWDRAGNRDRARELLRAAEADVPHTLLIDQPGVWAELASSWAVVGDPDESRRVYARAFTAAEGLENARPRALAAVSICRTMGREKQALDEGTRNRLDKLFYGLGDPW